MHLCGHSLCIHMYVVSTLQYIILYYMHLIWVVYFIFLSKDWWYFTCNNPLCCAQVMQCKDNNMDGFMSEWTTPTFSCREYMTWMISCALCREALRMCSSSSVGAPALSLLNQTNKWSSVMEVVKNILLVKILHSSVLAGILVNCSRNYMDDDFVWCIYQQDLCNVM